MDGSGFDALARGLAGRNNRRGLLAALPALAMAGRGHDGEARRRKRKPKTPCQPPTANLQALVNAAAPGSTIRLCAGVFPGLLTIGKDLTLVGAGAGKTTLSAQQSGTVLAVTAGRRVTVRGLAVTDGLVDDESAGGGIDNAGTLTLSDCAVRGNEARAGGGVRNRTGARLTIDDTVVAGNGAFQRGGGVLNEGDLVVRNGSTIGSTNPDDGNTARFGGGLYNVAAGTATFAKGTKVTGNEVNGGGGGTGFPNGGGIYNAAIGGVTLTTIAIVTGNTGFGEPNNCRGEPVANCVADA